MPGSARALPGLRAGDPIEEDLHRSRAELEEGIPHLRDAPADGGRVEMLCRRPAREEREVVDELEIDEVEGVVGDCWRTRGSSSTPDGSANPDAQITLMNARSTQLVATSRERWQLAGDQIFVDLDLSEANLPPGTRLQVGTAVLEVTALPHRGCGKFVRRFGKDAMKFVNSEVGRELNLRGINTRVVQGGVVRTGDEVRKQA